MADVDAEVWGTGDRVVLVHGSLATGPMEWEGQRSLVAEGYELVVPTRRGYAPDAGGVGEDYRTDAQDVAALLGDGAHLVGHSYGGIVALVAAAARPEAVRSLVLAEAPAFDAAPQHPAVAGLRRRVEEVLAADGDDRQFLEDFLTAVGTPLGELAPDVLDELTALVPALRLGRPPWEAPMDRLGATTYPAAVVSGNHHPAFTAICEALARRLGADHVVVEGAGHEMQTVTEDFNAALLAVWRRAGARTG